VASAVALAVAMMLALLARDDIALRLWRWLDPRASQIARSSVSASGPRPVPGAAPTSRRRPEQVVRPAGALASETPVAAGDARAAEANGSDSSSSESAGASPVAVRARPLAQHLAEIAAAARRGLVLAPEVSGDAVVVFDGEVSWQERLSALARVQGFQYATGEHLIEVWARGRDASIDAERASAAAVEASPPPDDDPPQAATAVDRPVHARADDLVTAVAKAARAAKVQVAADPGSNAVVIAGEETGVETISALVRKLDVPRRRFVLEAEIVELSHKARQELGVRWSIDGTVGALVDFPAGTAEGDGSAIIVATDGANALRARIGALASDGHVRVIARPRVVVLEGRPASIESVRILRVRFPESNAVVTDVENASAVTGGRAVEDIPVGVTLRVEPSMQGDGRIVLRIRAKSSTLGPPQPPDNIPEELSRMVDAEVAVADGETAVLGGLLREAGRRSGSGVPLLRSVPLVGTLFGKREHESDDEELLVLVTPKLLPP
jgi:hypothetical protein